MQVLGVRIPPASIDLPLGVSFPLYRHSALRVIVRGKGVPRVEHGPTLEISALNTSGSSVMVSDVSASVIYSAFPTEILLGSRTARLPLRELEGPPLSCVLAPGESAVWTADLRQRAEETPQPNLMPHTPFFEMSDTSAERWQRYGRAGTMLRNLLVDLTQRQLAVTLRDERGTIYKAKVRWQPPQGGPAQMFPVRA